MNPLEDSTAFGAPGIEPRWTSSAKEGVGTAYYTSCRVWFTLSHGIVNEIYYPHVDQPNTRDFQFVISDGERFATRKSATSTRLSRRGTRTYPSRILPCARCQASGSGKELLAWAGIDADHIAAAARRLLGK